MKPQFNDPHGQYFLAAGCHTNFNLDQLLTSHRKLYSLQDRPRPFPSSGTDHSPAPRVPKTRLAIVFECSALSERSANRDPSSWDLDFPVWPGGAAGALCLSRRTPRALGWAWVSCGPGPEHLNFPPLDTQLGLRVGCLPWFSPGLSAPPSLLL